MISVVTPTYNRKEMLNDVIKCLTEQTYSDWELIIIDDCSTDGTEEMMKQYKKNSKIRYYRNEKNMKNPGINRNKGFNLAKGDYVVFMDDDDYYIDNTFFERVMSIYSNNKNKDLCLVTANSYTESVCNGKRKKADIGATGFIDGIEFLLGIGNKYEKPQSTFTSVFTITSLKQAGLENMKMVNDYAIYLRALLFGNAYIISDCIGCYRIHDNNISFNIEKKFLMENLAERVWVKPKLIEKKGSKLVNTWWKNQMKILVRYFLFKSNPPKKDGKEVIKYIKKNTSYDLMFNTKLNIMYFSYKPYCFIKPFIKKILGK